jgi:membrane protein YqaA with SNARE-associated domain
MNMPAVKGKISVKVKRYIAVGILAAIVIGSVGGTVLLIKNWQYMALLEKQGFIGLFVISLFAGSPIPVPTPNMILTFTLGSVFNPVLVALVSSLGNAIGNAMVYFVGRGGLEFFKNLELNARKFKGIRPSRFARFLYKIKMPRINEFARKNALWAVFVLGMYPNPLLMTVEMGMGAARYNFWKFFIVCWAGKMVEALALSYLGYYGLRSILSYFGIHGL